MVLLNRGEIMKYDPLAYECQKCCLACNEDQRTCKYKKAREKLVRREVYAAKKEIKEGKYPKMQNLLVLEELLWMN